MLKVNFVYFDTGEDHKLRRCTETFPPHCWYEFQSGYILIYNAKSSDLTETRVINLNEVHSMELSREIK